MNKNFLFFILASALLVLSVITICLAPIINGLEIDDTTSNSNLFSEWNSKNCQKEDDDFKQNKIIGSYTNSAPLQKQDEAKIKECKRHKAMHGLEFAALIADIVLGFICTFLGLIHYVEQGKPFEKTSGLIGIASGGIATVLTVVYVVYSGIIFCNEPVRGRELLYDNKALFKWNGNKYVRNYDEQKAKDVDKDIKYIKYKDLGKKQYNYDTDIYQMSIDSDSEYERCREATGTSIFISQVSAQVERYRYSVNGNTKYCDYVWGGDESNQKDINRFLYDRWLTTIIFSC